MPLIYKITWPNGKIYVGSDLTDSVHYFGSPSKKSLELIAKDHPFLQQGGEIVIRKEILWIGIGVSKSELIRKEFAFIKQLSANNPSIGYNRSPPFKG